MKRVTHSHRRQGVCQFEDLEARQLMSASGTVTLAAHNLPLYLKDTAPYAGNMIVGVGYDRSKMFVQRFNSNGTLDTSFGDHGTVETLIHNLTIGERVVVQPDNKIVVAGVCSNAPGDDMSQWIVARYNANGTPDSSFGNGGNERVLSPQSWSDVDDMALQPDGKIVFVAVRKNGDDTDFCTVRLQKNGQLDPTFGASVGSTRRGYAVNGFGGNDMPRTLALQSDGKILVGGANYSGHAKPALLRLTADGRPDSTFDGDGKVTTDLLNNGEISSILVDGSTIYVGGELESTTAKQHLKDLFIVLKYNSAGKLDASFGSGMATARPIAHDVVADNVSLLMPQSGKLLVTGWVNDGTNSPNKVVAVQFDTAGHRDNSFANNTGQLTLNAPSSSLPGATKARVTNDGQVLVASGNNLFEFTETSTPGVYLNFGNDGYEGGVAGSTWFKRDAAYNFPTTIYFQVSGTATGGADYTGTLNVQFVTVASLAHSNLTGIGGTQLKPTGKVIIPAGQSAVRIYAPIVDDSKVESIELITSTIQPDSHYKILSGVSNISIIDNDSVTNHTTKTANKTVYGSIFSDDLIAA